MLGCFIRRNKSEIGAADGGLPIERESTYPFSILAVLAVPAIEHILAEVTLLAKRIRQPASGARRGVAAV